MFTGKVAKLFALLIVLVLLGAASNSFSQIPETFAGQKMSSFVKVFNSGDDAQWRAWVLEDPKATDSAEVLERRLEFFNMLYGDMGGIEFNRVEDQSEYSIKCLFKAVSPKGPFEWMSISLDYDTAAPHPFLGMGARPGEDPEDKIPEGELTHESIAAYLDSYIDEMVGKDKFSGTVLIAKDDQPFYTKAAGVACKRYDVPVKLDTKFNLGSMNKMFTSVAIAQLVQGGKLSYDDPVGKYLPDYPNAEVAEKVTIHHLLTHTSGMGSYWEEMFDTAWWEIKTVQQMADLTATKPLQFEPGERFHYSNCGPIVLGLIIEKITGQSYFDYVRENIYKPAGMINTDCYEVDYPTPNLAIGYTKMNYDESYSEDFHNNLFMHAVKGGPAGGGYSTVEDMLNFDIALRGYKLLNEEYTNIIITGKTERGPDRAYGYLFQDRVVDNERIVGHGGGAPGINGMLDMYWNSGYTVAAFSNYDEGASMVTLKIRKLLLAMLSQQN